jgi:hypothetical protein
MGIEEAHARRVPIVKNANTSQVAGLTKLLPIHASVEEALAQRPS